MKTMRTLLWVGLLALSGIVPATRAAEAHDVGSPFVGEIRAQASDACRAGWLPMDGRQLPIQNYVPLFSLIGTTYGGDGQTTFALPKLDCSALNLVCCIATEGVISRP